MSYGKVHESFWTDEKIIGLSTAAKLLAIYFVSGPHRNAIGCMRIPLGYIQGDLGWGIEGASEALRELSEARFIIRDDATGWTLIRNLLKYDPVKGDKAAIGAARIAATVPKNSVVYEALHARLQPILDRELKGRDGISGYPMEAPSKGDAKPHPSPYPSFPSPVPDQVAAADARARDPRFHEVGKKILSLCGDSPNLLNYGRVEAWLRAGADPELDIYPAIRTALAKLGKPPNSLNYFDGAVADAVARRTKPMPEGRGRRRADRYDDIADGIDDFSRRLNGYDAGPGDQGNHPLLPAAERREEFG